jgi:nucleoside-diphosphate-sugar epimerase
VTAPAVGSGRVLVTGATGLIGSCVLGPLVAAGFDVHAVARSVPAGARGDVTWHAADLLDDGQRGGVVQRAAAMHLLHLAWYAEHGRFWEAPENVAWTAATVRLVQEFTAAGGRRAVVAGSCAEYEWGAAGVLAEDCPLRPATLYGTCKDATRRVAERLVPELAWGRVFFLYGPGEHQARLVASIARAVVAGDRAPLSAGTQRRDFLHVDDVAGAFAALVSSDVTGAVNIGSGVAISVLEVAQAIAEAGGRPDLLDVGALEQRPGDPVEIVADVGRLRDEVGWTPRVGLREGLAATVRWWREQSA